MIDAIGFVMEIFSLLICIYALYNRKFVFDIYNIMLITIDVIWLVCINQFTLSSLWSVCIYPILFLFCIVEFDKDIGVAIINTILSLIIAGGIQFLGFSLYIINFMNNPTIANLTANMFLLFMMVMLKHFVPVYKLSSYLKSKQKSIVMIMSFSFLLIFTYIVLYKKNHRIRIRTAIVIILIFIIYTVVCEWQKNKMRSKELQKELETERLYAESFEALITNIRRRQHDFDNHINTLKGLQLTNRSYEELVKAQNEYCGQMGNNAKFDNLLTGGNPTISGYLYSKFLEIDDKGIQIIYEVKLGKQITKIPTYKLIELIGNLLDNAVDTMVSAKPADRKLVVDIIQADNIEVEVRNQSDYIPIETSKRFFEQGYSTKGDNRGLGLYNVKQICIEYGIQIICDNIKIEEQNWFGLKLKI